LENAIKNFQKSLTEHRTPDILTKLRDTEKLKAVRDRESYQNPELADEARGKGNELFKVNKFAEAIPHYTESIKRAEKDPRGYSNRAACYMKLMALPDAEKDAEKAIELDPTFGTELEIDLYVQSRRIFARQPFSSK
jgi:stress-induced-phosphoprotein 1